MINSHNLNNTYDTTFKHFNCNMQNKISFGGKVLIPKESVSKFIEKFANQLSVLASPKKTKYTSPYIKDFHNKIKDVDSASETFIKYLYDFERKYAACKEVEINLESGRLAEIGNSNTPNIFMINHVGNMKNLSELLHVFLFMLTDKYMKVGKALTCPRPKVIVKKDFLNAMSQIKRAVFEKLLCVGVDANIAGRNKKENTKSMINLLSEFIKDKVNIFIFPEGKMALYKDLDLISQFQTGIAGLVNAASKHKKFVKVVPIGFAVNEKSDKFLGSIYLGKPVYFKRNGEQLLSSRGNIDSDFASQTYINFFNNSKPSLLKTITVQGKPVTGHALKDYIAGILCENLRICKTEAIKQLPQTSLEGKIILC